MAEDEELRRLERVPVRKRSREETKRLIALYWRKSDINKVKAILTPFDNKLAETVRIEHYAECKTSNYTACDITAAYDNNLYLWAAYLLIGASECPKTEKALAKFYDIAGKELAEELIEADRVEMLAVPHRECASCGSVTWGENEEYCGNCFEELREDDT